MYKYIVLLILLPMMAWAEPFQINVTEPASQAGALARTCFYYCTCKQASTCTCSTWVPAGSPHCIASDDGNGGDTLNHTFNLPIQQGDLPVTVRYTATTVNDDGNETTRGAVVATHTFTAE
jgi:hypothetical protein